MWKTVPLCRASIRSKLHLKFGSRRRYNKGIQIKSENVKMPEVRFKFACWLRQVTWQGSAYKHKFHSYLLRLSLNPFNVHNQHFYSPWPEEGLEFSTLWCRSVFASFKEWEFQLRDFPQPLMLIRGMHVSDLCIVITKPKIVYIVHTKRLFPIKCRISLSIGQVLQSLFLLRRNQWAGLPGRCLYNEPNLYAFFTPSLQAVIEKIYIMCAGFFILPILLCGKRSIYHLYDDYCMYLMIAVIVIQFRG